MGHFSGERYNSTPHAASSRSVFVNFGKHCDLLLVLNVAFATHDLHGVGPLKAVPRRGPAGEEGPFGDLRLMELVASKAID